MTIKVPGKLMLAGEYAVTKTGHPALVMAVNRFADKTSSQFVDQQTHQKLGLGSSAAYRVFQLKQEHPEWPESELFRAALTQSRQDQPHNSGADVAASVYTGVLHYRRDQVLAQLDWPAEWELLVGWTGAPASTAQLVDEQTLTGHFLETSDQAVEQLVRAIQKRRFDQFEQGIRLAQTNLSELPGVMTPSLTKLVKAAEQLKLPAKVSGAGGGDSGIAFSDNPIKSRQLIETWREQGIQTLDLSIYYK